MEYKQQLIKCEEYNQTIIDKYSGQHLDQSQIIFQLQQKECLKEEQDVQKQISDYLINIKSKLEESGFDQYIDDQIQIIQDKIIDIELIEKKILQREETLQKANEKNKLLENENEKKYQQHQQQINKQNELNDLRKKLDIEINQNLNNKKIFDYCKEVQQKQMNNGEGNVSQYYSEIAFEIVQISHNDLYNQQQLILLKLSDINQTLSELQILQTYQDLKVQEEKLSKEIQNLGQKINQDKQLLIDMSIKLNYLNDSIINDQIFLQNCQQKQKLIEENIKENEKQIQQYEENMKLLHKLIQEYEITNELNEKILQNQNDILQEQMKCQEKTIDNYEQDELINKLQQIQLEIDELNLNHQNWLKYDRFLKQLEQKRAQFFGIESYLNQQHSCRRQNHFCDQKCQGCTDSSTMCKYLAGHSSEQQSHLCSNDNHYCKEKCQVQNCESQCQYQFNHSNELDHICSGQHVCLQNCQFCSKQCVQSIQNKHITHQCEQINCAKLCFFNSNFFSEHKKCINQCTKQHCEDHEYHICSNQAHQCYKSCKQNGICQISTYSEINKEWITKNGSKFPYKIYRQNSELMQCQEIIQQDLINHNHDHDCKSNHICDQRCPECEAFCTLKYGHQGKHQPHLHRNKEQQIFTVLEGCDFEKLLVQEDGYTREYIIGESSEPETCLTSCSRRSRSHFHLLQCDNGINCAEKILNKNSKIVARHQNKKYQGSDQYYDEILCENYWNFLGWEHPVSHGKRNQISLCNFYCKSCKDVDQQFCIKEAWHTESKNYQDHQFTCSDKHKTNGLDLCFLLDTTGSSRHYIKQVKKLIQKLINSTQKYIEKNKQVFMVSIVGYKDHCDGKDIIKSQNFCDHVTALKFIEDIEVGGGGDIPEATLDGLQAVTELGWREKTKRFVVLIADCPPHGNPKFHSFEDDYKDGCPCGIDEKILTQFTSKNIELFIYRINDNLDLTIQIFQKIMPTITVLRNFDDEQFIQYIDELVCQELQIREITLTKQK